MERAYEMAKVGQNLFTYSGSGSDRARGAPSKMALGERKGPSQPGDTSKRRAQEDSPK